MDTSNFDWWTFPRSSKEFGKGVDEYIERCLATECKGNQIRCPCKDCHLRNWFCRDTVKDHMISRGLGRLPVAQTEVVNDAMDAVHDERVPPNDGDVNNFPDRIDDLLNDTFRNGLDDDTQTFFKLVKEVQEELYPGCKDFSRLSFLMRLFVYKRDHKLSNSAFTDLLKLLKAMKPQPKEVLVCQQQKSQQYLPPGCMSRFLNMRKYKGPRRQEHIGSSSLVEEQQRSPETAFASGLNEIDVSEEAALNQIQLENAPNTIENEPAENSVTKEKKHRGMTILAHVHARTMENRPPVIFNDLGQPVGPTEEVVSDFSRLLGTLAKNSAFAPLNYESWKHMPLKEKIWEYVKKKFILDEDAKKYVLENVNAKWRLYKTRIKDKYYNKDESMEDRMAKRPKNIPEEEFEGLMLYWDSEKSKEISKKNKENREKQCDMHTLGPKSFAILRDEMKQSDPNKKEPSQADLYIASRKRNPGRTYLTPDDITLENIDKMKKLIADEEGSNQIDPYYDVITKKEHSGRLRMYGQGVTKSTLKTKDPNAPYKIPSVFTQQIEKKIAEQMGEKIIEQVEKTVAQQVEQKLAYFVSKIREANQGKDVHIPDFTSAHEDLSSSRDESIGDSGDEFEGTPTM